MHLILLLTAQLAAATLTSTPATTCHINGAPCTTVAVTPHPSWAPALGGTEWISIAPTGWPLATYLANGTVVSFSEVFTLDSMPSAAMVTWAADDSASVWLNGSLVAPEAPAAGNGYSVCSDFAPTCRYHTKADILPWLLVGSNEIRFDVAQRGGYSYGLNYAVGLTWLDEPPLPTPEPGTRAPLGIGIGCIAGYLYFTRRAERKARRYGDALLHIASCSRDEDSKAVARKALKE